MNWDVIFNAGVNEGQPHFLTRKIVLSNQVVLVIIGLVALPFTILSLFLFPSIAYLPAVGIFVCALTVLLNSIGAHQAGRILLAILPTYLAIIYQAYLVPADEPPVYKFIFLISGFSLLPFILFDLREKILLWSSVILNVIPVMIFRQIMDVFEKPLDNAIFREGLLSDITLVIGLGTGFGIVLLMSFMNQKSEAKVQRLFSEMETRNTVLQENEEQMKRNLEELKRAQEVEKKRTWISEGLARFGSIWRQNSSMQDTGDKLITEMVKYLQANQGGLYIVQRLEEGTPYIQLLSCYAYGRKKFVEQEIQPGQGLLGQAFLEEDVVHISDVPEQFVRISSGLGEARPRAVLIVPFKAGDRVEALVELASFREFAPHEIDFLKQLGEGLAAYIASERLNEQTRTLLQNVQSQAEEMRAQEEEMRQNMEELQATQEEMQRKEREYRQRIEELEQQVNAAQVY